MIVAQIQGGLGNQMFQYAAGRRLSLHRNVPLKLDLTWFSLNRSRRFVLDKFNIQVTKNNFINKPFAYAIGTLDKAGLTRRVAAKDKGDLLIHVGPLAYLYGYWQDPKYFEDIQEKLRQELTLKQPLSLHAQNVADEICKCNSVSVHVRQGDRIGELDFLWPRYYVNAVQQIRCHVDNLCFYIFSDGRLDLTTVFDSEDQAVLVAGNMDYEDFSLMTLCKHHIVANSTFSWWAAYLARAGLTIAPARNEIRCPSSWMRI